MSAAARTLIHVHHLLGVGHLRRALALARGLAEAGAEVTVASGGMPVPNLPTTGLDFVQLPPARARDATFKELLDETGAEVDDAWRARRARALLDLFAARRPHLVVTELYPFGRRLLRFELEPLLREVAAQASRPLMACSLRDIIHPPAPARIRGIVDLVRGSFDLVLVHADPALIDLDLSFPAVARIADRLHYTGYLLEQPPAPARRPAGEPEVLVSSGGGAVGEPLLRAALGARPLSRFRDRPWRLLAGHNLPEDRFQSLRRRGGPGVTVERAREDFVALLPRALCSVSQAGYNTAIEVLSARVPAVFVPFADAGELEQTLRCHALAERGLCRWLPPQHLTPVALAAAIDAAQPPPEGFSVEVSGAERSATLLLRAIREQATFPPHLRQVRES
ncbi:MAG: glycosyltransferase [Alphaproteobacteria bacterium]|nr:glycosyltransferase [Alphaproteobacteria bacterium]